MTLDEVAKKAGPQDLFVLSLSGHGVMDGDVYYFIPHEFKSGPNGIEESLSRQAIAVYELEQWIKAVPALKRVTIYDTCQSGGVVEAHRTARNPFQFRKAIETMSRSTGSYVIAAAAATDEAQEVPDLGHGILTYALLAGLGAVDRGPLRNRSVEAEEDVVQVRDWFQFAQDEVPALTKVYFGREQFVKYSASGKDFPILPLKASNVDAEAR